MKYPKLIILKSRHQDYKFHVKNEKDYQKVGLELLKIMKEYLHWIQELKSEDLQIKLEEELDLPFKDIEELSKHPLASKIKIVGKKSNNYVGGYRTPSGDNIIKQIQTIKQEYKLVQENNKKVKLVEAILKDQKGTHIWTLVHFFADDKISIEDYN